MKELIKSFFSSDALLITLLVAIFALCALCCGCTTARIKTPEWEATVTSHWLKRDVDKLAVTRLADGSYTVDLNGYKTDASEQFPAFTRETLSGLAVIARIAAAAYNPAATTVAIPAATTTPTTTTTATTPDNPAAPTTTTTTER